MRASLIVAGLVVAVPAFVYGASARGQAPAGVAQPSSTQPVAAAPHKGLMVHGQWKIVVRNADGTTASTTDFENSLVDNGFTLEHLMLGSIVTGSWGIEVAPDSGAASPCGKAACLIVTSTSTGPGVGLCSAFSALQPTSCSGGLAYVISGSIFQLSGQFIASQAGKITSVSTLTAFCATDSSTFATITSTSPSACAGGTVTAAAVGQFTSATAASTPAFAPVTITSGQTVQITVAVSFS